MTPKEKWKALIQETIEKINEIDSETGWELTEPRWWLGMMEVEQLLIEQRAVVASVKEGEAPNAG